MTDVSLIAALLAGVLALLSPCSALLLPSFFAYAFASRTALVARTLVFYVGLALTLVPLGMGSAPVSQLFVGHRSELSSIAGGVSVALEAICAPGGGLAVRSAENFKTGPTPGRGAGGVATLVLGAVYGFAGCYPRPND